MEYLVESFARLLAKSWMCGIEYLLETVRAFKAQSLHDLRSHEAFGNMCRIEDHELEEKRIMPIWSLCSNFTFEICCLSEWNRHALEEAGMLLMMR